MSVHGGRGDGEPPGWRTHGMENPPGMENQWDGELPPQMETTPPPRWRTPRMENPPDGDSPRWRLPQMENPPGWRTPPDGEPPKMETPRWRTPPDGEPPRMENPPWDGEPPLGQCAGGTHPTGMHSCYILRMIHRWYLNGGSGSGVEKKAPADGGCAPYRKSWIRNCGEKLFRFNFLHRRHQAFQLTSTGWFSCWWSELQLHVTHRQHTDPILPHGVCTNFIP